MEPTKSDYQIALERLVREARASAISLDAVGWDLWQEWVNEQQPPAAYVIDRSAVKNWWEDPRKPDAVGEARR